MINGFAAVVEFLIEFIVVDVVLHVDCRRAAQAALLVIVMQRAVISRLVVVRWSKITS